MDYYSLSLKRLLILILVVLGATLKVTNGFPQTSQQIWVKAQGHLDNQGRLIVDEIKKRQSGDTYVLEGLVEKVTVNFYRVAGITIKPRSTIKYVYISGQAAHREDIKQGVRIKAIGGFGRSDFHAQEIRIFQYSDDDDVELEGPLQLMGSTDQQHNLYRIGPISLFRKTNTRQEQITPIAGLNRILSASAKLKYNENSRVTDVQEENLAGQSNRYGKLQTTLRSRFSRKVRIHGRFELFWRNRIQSDPLASTANVFEFRVREIYLRFNDLAGIDGLQFRAGRQRFRDTRTWLMDSRLDALQLIYSRPSLRFTFAATRGLGKRDTHADQQHYIGSAYIRFGRGLKTTFYAIKELDQRAGRDNPFWLAVHMRGTLDDIWDWWAQGARYSSRLDQTDRIGYAYDAGGIFRPFRSRKGLFLSYHRAYGSADDLRTPDRRERFRQPRLQLNYYRYGGRKRMYYYGKLLSPELANLKFQAFGLGYTISRRMTLQGILRSYKQIRPSTIIRSNSLGFSPEGQSGELGRSAEMLLDLWPLAALQVSLSAEWFLPGAAFQSQTKSVFGLNAELVFYF